MMGSHIWFRAAAIGWATVVFAAGAARGENTIEIGCSGVYSKAAQMAQELELLRLEMGRPLAEPLPLHVSDVAPRDIYFQALTLHRKADRLAQEWTGDSSPLGSAVEREIRFGDALVLVEAALERIGEVKRCQGIGDAPRELAQEFDKTPADVFKLIHRANRQLNLLLDEQFSPRGVYQQVTICVDLASQLLKRFPNSTPIPDAPAFQRRKRPADVYRQLLACLQQLQRISARSKQRMLQITSGVDIDEFVTPSDVYELATLLRAQLSHLNRLANGNRPERSVYLPGRKVPSHVYQRSGILRRQLDQLEAFAKLHPAWIDRGVASP